MMLIVIYFKGLDYNSYFESNASQKLKNQNNFGNIKGICFEMFQQ